METAPAVLFSLFLIGELLLIIGLYGRRSDDHPICRRCGFDLFGKSPDTTVCSECGARLDVRRAVRIGHRKRRGVIASAGALLVITASAAMVSHLYMEVNPGNWRRAQPSWMLINQLRSPTSGYSNQLQELHARMAANKLSSEHIRAVADIGLAAQVNNSGGWLFQWGDFIQDARQLGRLSDAQWKRYLDQLLPSSPEFRARSSVRRGDPWPMSFEVPEFRGGSPRRLTLLWHAKLSIDGVDVPVSGTDYFEHEQQFEGCWEVWSQPIDAKLIGPLRDGAHTLRLEVTGSILDSRNSSPIVSQPPQLHRIFEQNGTLTPQSLNPIRLIHDPSLAPQILKSLKINFAPGGVGMSHTGKMTPFAAHVDLTSKAAAVSLAHSVFVRLNGTEREVMPFICKKGAYGFASLGKIEEVEHADIILRPNPKLAIETIDQDEVWDGELILHDVSAKMRSN